MIRHVSAEFTHAGAGKAIGAHLYRFPNINGIGTRRRVIDLGDEIVVRPTACAVPDQKLHHHDVALCPRTTESAFHSRSNADSINVIGSS
ncbi:hypothetical protein [Bosea rubneri]|uniref:Uncharacterized protein n=1 Tax=Bosea rubneri TaxID=3075434 RepID=A0ABU3S924_9HYPH|nr:hypothetical protein [Bosea sp. ZW T0_25]MDU0341300.1 hypothetical protein [Bosea sp. ZW T0_25]